MNYSSRFYLYAPFSLFVLFALGTVIWWWLAASSLDRRLDAINGHDIAPGVQVRFASREQTGFPFRLDTVFHNLCITVPGSHGAVFWQAEEFAIHQLIYDADQWLIEAAGKQTVGWIDAEGRPRQVVFTPASLHASTIVSDGHLSRFDVDIVGVSLPRVGAARAQFHIRRDPDSDMLDVAMSGDDVRIRSPEPAPLGNRILHFELDGRLNSADLLAALLSGHSRWRDAAEHWRKDGVASVDRLALTWGKLSLSGSGALALDDQRRPKGLLDIRLANFGSLLGVIGASGQGFGPAIVNAAAGEAGRKGNALPVRIAFKDGIAYVGTVPATTLDPLY